jgi:hypothetical protein
MLHDTLSRYLFQIENAIDEIKNKQVEHFEAEVLSSRRVNLRIRIRIGNKYLLEMNEAVFIKNKGIGLLIIAIIFKTRMTNLFFVMTTHPISPS